MAREIILNNIRKNLPGEQKLPEKAEFPFDSSNTDPVSAFTSMVRKMGGVVCGSADEVLEKWPPSDFRVVSAVETIHLDPIDPGDLSKLEEIDLAFIKGDFGVFENGAIWVPEANLPHRILPFITQHLAIVLDRSALVANMHEAYERIDLSESPYGVFIAGPSKTADIEQSLVIGAQGARSLHIVLI